MNAKLSVTSRCRYPTRLVKGKPTFLHSSPDAHLKLSPNFFVVSGWHDGVGRNLTAIGPMRRVSLRNVREGGFVSHTSFEANVFGGRCQLGVSCRYVPF